MTNGVMLAMGTFRFQLSTASYQELNRSTQYRWVSQPRLGRSPGQQFVGKGEDTLRLSGVIYPHFRGGLGQIEAMRREAEKGEPLLVADGLGDIHGNWVIKSITEGQRRVDADGIPRRQDFEIQMIYYGDDKTAAGL